MTTNIIRATEVIGQLTGDGELGRSTAQAIAQHLADAGLIAPDLPEFEDQDLVGIDDHGHIFVRHEVDDQWLAVEEAHDLAFALLTAADQAEDDMAEWIKEDEDDHKPQP